MLKNSSLSLQEIQDLTYSQLKTLNNNLIELLRLENPINPTNNNSNIGTNNSNIDIKKQEIMIKEADKYISRMKKSGKKLSLKELNNLFNN